MTVWYYFNDIYPPLHEGHSPLDPPAWWIRLIEGRPAPIEEEPAVETGATELAADVAPVQ
jgi:Derlin-2/3